MAINPQGLLAQLSPAKGLDLSGMFGSPGQSLARQQLKLAREKFEEEKRQAEEQKELDRLRLAGQQAQQQALAERERLDREAEAQAELLKQRQAGALKYSEAVNSGQPDQVEALRPYLESLGSGIDITRGEGMPSYRFHMDAEADRNKGWETATRPLDQGAYDAEPPPLAAAPTPGETGTVTDMQAMADDRLSRIGPAFRDIVKAHPEAYRDLAGEAAVGVGSMNLPADKALTELRMQLGGPIELMKAQMQADAQKEQFREKRDQVTPQDISAFGEKGRKSAETLATKNKIPEAATALELADQIYDMLDDPNGGNDTMIGGALLQMQAVKGDPSDRELKSAFGAEKLSLMDELFSFIQEKARTGFSDPQREAIRSYVKRTAERQQAKVYDYLDSARGLGSSYNDYEKQGFRERADQMVPDHWRAQYDEDRAKRKGAGKGAEMAGSGKTSRFDPSPSTGDFEIELEAQAMENDLDPDKIKGIIGPESGGRANARNEASGATGLIQFLPSIAEGLGTSTEELAKMTPAEQLPFVMKHLSERGVTSDSPPEDYAMAVAAPNFIGKPPETVVYPKGSKAWEQNPAWRPAGGGDITVASIQAYYSKGGSAKSAEAPKADLPAPTTAAERRMRELMEREGR